MLAQVLCLLRVVVAVVDLDFVVLRRLEVEIYSNLLDPGWAQIVVDDLSLAKFLPHAP